MPPTRALPVMRAGARIAKAGVVPTAFAETARTLIGLPASDLLTL